MAHGLNLTQRRVPTAGGLHPSSPDALISLPFLPSPPWGRCCCRWEVLVWPAARGLPQTPYYSHCLSCHWIYFYWLPPQQQLEAAIAGVATGSTFGSCCTKRQLPLQQWCLSRREKEADEEPGATEMWPHIVSVCSVLVGGKEEGKWQLTVAAGPAIIQGHWPVLKHIHIVCYSERMKIKGISPLPREVPDDQILSMSNCLFHYNIQAAFVCYCF